MWCDGDWRLSSCWPHPGTWRGYYLYFVTLSGEVWGAGAGQGGAGRIVSRGSAQHPTPSSAVLMKTSRGAPASREHWRHGHTFRWRHMCGSRYQMMESVSVSPSLLVIKVMKCTSICRVHTCSVLCWVMQSSLAMRHISHLSRRPAPSLCSVSLGSGNLVSRLISRIYPRLQRGWSLMSTRQPPGHLDMQQKQETLTSKRMI